MDKFAQLDSSEQDDLFREVAARKGLREVIIEKDFWVCYVLDKLFKIQETKDIILFKGGTSLSKVFGLINRFSEDIDIILDWRVLTDEDPSKDRSSNKQHKIFIKKLRDLTADYLENTIAPILEKNLNGSFVITVDKEKRCINIEYPAIHHDRYVSSIIQLEIGPIASWVPNSEYTIKSFTEEELPDQFSGNEIKVKAIKAERTYWEKVTILHSEAHRKEESRTPPRYSRHYYDVFMMSNSKIIKSAYDDLSLLADVVKFKKKFYSSPWSHYDLAKPGTLKLLPQKQRIDDLKKDYKDMEEMIFGEPPQFEKILSIIKNIESEFNNL